MGPPTGQPGSLVPAGAENVTVAVLAAGNDVAWRCEGLMTGTRTW